MMILAIDVDYRDNQAFIAALSFESWRDESESAIYISRMDDIADYVPGAFYRRELPCILKVIQDYELTPEVIVIDGFVWLDGESNPGLGAKLYDALDGTISVIGVAKKSFKGISDQYALYRGESQKPLYITSVGIDDHVAIDNIKNMAGDNRLPILLKTVDRLCRQAE